MIPRLGSVFPAFALFLVCACGADAPTPTGQKSKTPEPKERTLSLTTGYLFDAVLQDKGRAAHEISLKVTLDAKGTGKGTMELDPNFGQVNDFGDVVGRTEIATHSIPITLKQIKKDDPRLLYEIQEHRWALVVAPGPTGHRLLWKDKEGKILRVLPQESLGKRDVPLEPCHPGCFPAKTNILTPDGAKAIETIRKGDQILAVDKQGKPCPARVRSVFISRSYLVEIETESGRLTTTNKQPLCLHGGICKCAEDLAPGEELLHWQDGKSRPAKIRAIQKTKQLAQVFNLVLEDQQYFIAGAFQVRAKPPLEAETTSKDATRD